MKLKTYIRSMARSVQRGRLYARVTWYLENRSARNALSKDAAPTYDLAVLASDGRGNIGDQAMLEAIWEHFPGRILIIAESATAVQLPKTEEHRVFVTLVPGALSAFSLLRGRRRRQLWALLAQCRGIGVIGADVMDGLYSPSASIVRASIVAAAQKHGLSSRIFGFSWSDTPTMGAVWALQNAAARGVRILPRDPISRKRLDSNGVQPTIPSADLVFAETSVREVIDVDTTEPYALINASGLIAQGKDLTQDYLRLIEHVRHLGLKPVLLPHVLRDLDDDLAALRRIYEAADPKPVLISRQLAPQEIRFLASHAAFVVTGRMHLSIMSLNMGAAPFTLATVGKVEGLFELVAAPELVLSPTPGFSRHLIQAVPDVRTLELLSTRISPHLSAVRRLSQENFAGLPASPIITLSEDN